MNSNRRRGGLRVSQLLYGVLALLLVWTWPLYAQDVHSIKNGVVKITAQVEGKTKIGTGIIVRQDHNSVVVVTASHVIEGDATPQVEFYTQRNRLFESQVIAMEGGDPRGLASLLVQGNIPEVRILSTNPSEPIRAGDRISMIGFPRQAGALWAVTKGELVGQQGKDLVFSGVVDEGNSGGPLLKDEHVVGIITEASPPFAYATPGLISNYVLKGWGVQFGVRLRSKPAVLTPTYLELSIREKGLHHPFDSHKEGLVGGIVGTLVHAYELRKLKGAAVVIDHATGLMWQQSGSPVFIDAWTDDGGGPDYIDNLNKDKMAGFSDWRMPTVEELASLLEPIGMNDGLFIDPLFDKVQWVCWTVDQLIKRPPGAPSYKTGPWIIGVDFSRGRINYLPSYGEQNSRWFVRAVRTLETDPSKAEMNMVK